METLLNSIAKSFPSDITGTILLCLIVFGGLSVTKFAYKVTSDRNVRLGTVLQELVKTVAENTTAIRQLESELKRMDQIFKKIPEIENNIAVHEVRLQTIEKNLK